MHWKNVTWQHSGIHGCFYCIYKQIAAYILCSLKIFSRCQCLDFHSRDCRTQYWTQATSMQDADCLTTCETELEDLCLLRLSLPGWRQFIWMLLIIVLAERFLILVCQRQNPLFFAQFFSDVSRARLRICARNTFHKRCYWHEERHEKGCWEWNQLDDLPELVFHSIDEVANADAVLDLPIFIVFPWQRNINLRERMKNRTNQIWMQYNQTNIVIVLYPMGSEVFQTTWDLRSSPEAKSPQRHHQKALYRTETQRWRR